MIDLEHQIRTTIENRKEWEDKVTASYEIRMNGIPRAEMPYPNAPDNNSQLSDAHIDRHKPFYVSQLYAGEHIAGFIGKQGQDAEVTGAIAQWFDCMVKDRSNYNREMISAIDVMLETGGCPVKVRWDTKKKCLAFTACDPLFVIVPKHTEEYKDADWLVHVIPLSEAQYRRNKSYEQGDDYIKSIKGKGEGTEVDTSGKQQAVDLREGLTCSNDENIIIVWEIQERQDDGTIIVKTRSPIRFDVPIKADFKRPYNKGVLGENAINFVKVRPEITRKGHTAPRGLVEIIAPNEARLNKALNYIGEHQDFHTRPTFTQDPQVPTGSTGNFKNRPGAILPAGLNPTVAPPLPGGLFDMLQYYREQTEYRSGAPDFGVMEQQGGKRTATEINEISQQSGQGTSMRNRIFRCDLNDIIQMSWALCLQYGADSLDYVSGNSYKNLDASDLVDEYEVRLSGNADAWDKATQMNKAAGRFQMLRDDPYINQGELRKDFLSADEPGMVKRLYQEPADQQLSQMEEQAQEISVMLLGFAAKVDPPDVDVVHVEVTCQWVLKMLQTREPILPEMARLVLKHLSDHTESATEKKDPGIKMVTQKYGHLVQILSQIAGMQDPRELAAQQPQLSVVPGPGGTSPPVNLSPAGPPASAPQTEQQPMNLENQQ